MKKMLSMLPLIVLVVLLPACSVSEEAVVDTDFERMLGYVPDSVIERYDIWYDNWAQAKQLHGATDVTSIEDGEELWEEQRAFVFEVSNFFPWQRLWLPQVAAEVGFNLMMVDRIIYTNIPPNSFSISEGSFDEDLIAGKLTDLGYKKTDYGDCCYYGIRGDYEIDMRDLLGGEVLSAMNRIAIFDDTLIIAPATDNVTDVLDAMSGTGSSAIDNPSIRALADSLSEVLTAVITTPERVFNPYYSIDEVKDTIYYFDVPQDWGSLHQYEMAGTGLRAEGDERYCDIALYYGDRDDAQADGIEIIKRMKSYQMGTTFEEIEPIPLTDCFEIGEPSVKKYREGAVLKISCRLISGARFRASSFIKGWGGLRDLLFLAPDPSLYVAD